MTDITAALELARQTIATETLGLRDHLTGEQKRECGCGCTGEFGDSPCAVHVGCEECGVLMGPGSYQQRRSLTLARALIATHAELERARREVSALAAALNGDEPTLATKETP